MSWNELEKELVFLVFFHYSVEFEIRISEEDLIEEFMTSNKQVSKAEFHFE